VKGVYESELLIPLHAACEEKHVSWMSEERVSSEGRVKSEGKMLICWPL
jgi:hypothetical protein